MSDTASAIEAAQRLADYALEHDAAEEAVTDDLRLIELPIRALQATEGRNESLFSNVSVGDRRLTWRELVEQQRDEIARLSAFARMVSDLDRNEHGRHEGDVDSSDASGISQGNPHLPPVGATIGYGIHGRVIYRMPPRGQRHDPAAWESAS